MEQLNGLDAFFVHGESPRTPMHIAAMLVYKETTRVHPDIRHQNLCQRISHALPLSTVFRRRLVTVPKGLDHPYWIEDADFALEKHVFRHRLGSKANHQNLEQLLATLHGQAMDFSKPLWEAHIIDGLGQLPEYPSNSYGLFLKVHHAALDGVSATQILASLHDNPQRNTSSNIDNRETDSWVGEPAPSSSRLLWRAYINHFRRPLHLLSEGRKLLPKMQRAKAQHDGSQVSPEGNRQLPPSWQRSPFNKKITAERQLLSLHFELDALNSIRKQQPGTTLNQVLLAIVSGGLRHYLIAQNQLPADPLGGLVPINVRTKKSGKGGNALGMMVAGLRVDIEDPLQRLQAVRYSAHCAKKSSDSMGRFSLMNVAKHMPSLAEKSLLWGLSAACQIPGGLPMPLATVLSNIPGPRESLSLNGAELVDIQAIGLITDGCGLFHVALSYQQRICLTVLSAPNTLTQPEKYRDCLQQSYQELLTATGH
ncbi:acyltransferase, WS/DGAT/MGAT [Spongiibacter sp. IMCC21906]|uniref:wax ester/triacylglycerol synthase family O-acyltransferase n=1 Tax=Spongiibacter sp. IMCC21906 TaxID=1620392 RepID=UPI00062E058F|nr:wax ester/triacylglycerol synthase family O-acyltransferase [Spongiibacter sp. IMCC21906]AKH68744.1 acyltransferase, WS/DGAT/MGAT [Spongiibacter sp. IMCC21906]